MQNTNVVDPVLLEAARRVTKKRPKVVVDHIIKHGYVSTQDLKDIYGYDHPPRAARDLREEGIPLETFYITGTTGRKIGAYRFGDVSQISQHKLGGRQTFSKPFKKLLLDRDGCKCALCSLSYEDRYLTIDHRVPYEVTGEAVSDERQPENFMLLCGTCQRKKSWSCEQCINWILEKNVTTCNTCYWAQPENHTHLAGLGVRRIEIVWTGAETHQYDGLKQKALAENKTIQDIIKTAI